MAERLRDELVNAGLSVDWQSFRGGHEIPQSVINRLSGFVDQVLATS
jgi:phospholipase/carboxylesterase